MSNTQPVAGAGAVAFSGSHRAVLTILRMAIGWHFLYEGIAKLLIPDWTSAGYLQTAQWIFAGFFRWLAGSPDLLKLADFLNIWGLTLIGLALFVGVFIRSASVFGMVLIALYYLAHPSLVATDFRLPVEGHYLFINKNLIELIALLVLAVLPSRITWGISQFFPRFCRTSVADEAEEPGSRRIWKLRFSAPGPLNRRQIVASLAALPFLGIFGYGTRKKYNFEKVHAITGATIKAPESRLDKLSGPVPVGRIGDLTLSRVILGNNLIGGWAHARDLIYASKLFKAYNTERKVFETLEIAEHCGINAIMLVNAQFPLFRKYLKLVSGKMQTICQCFPNLKDIKTDIDKAIDNGATTIYIQGGMADRFVLNQRVDLLGKAFDYMKSQGYVAGMGTHSIETLLACEKAGIKPDYYVKTLHHDRYWSAHPRENRVEFEIITTMSEDHNRSHDNMFDLFPEKTIEFMKHSTVPWIAFKVLAGGAIHPKDGFNYAFSNGADFICVGMFDFQVVEDVNIARDILSRTQLRERRWMA
ncbi:MAG: DoxX family protein [Acidobacteriota bacterium]